MTTLDRRTFVRGAAFGVAAAAITPVLAACSTEGSTTTLASKLAPFPAYVHITKGPKPDLPGSKTVQPVYFTRTKTEFKSVTGKIGNGGSVSALVITYSPPPPTDNDFLKFIGKKANVDFKMSVTPGEQYANKFAATVAGGDIPDFVQFLLFALPARYPDLLKARFADLTPYLSGDAIKKYPNLANITTPAWSGTRINGRLYGVPTSRPPFGDVLITRPDLFRKYGVADDLPKNKDDFLSFCKELTSAKANRYAIVGSAGPLTGPTPTPRTVSFASAFIGGMFKLPNAWEYKDGKLTSSFEVPQYLDYVDYTKKLWDAGVFHPDSPSIDASKANTLQRAGTAVMYCSGILGIADGALPANVELDAMVPFGADGGTGYNYQGPSAFSFTAIKKSSKSRIEELLRVMNFLAAPAGSEESTWIYSGEEGVHFTRGADASITLTPKGIAEVAPTNIYRISPGPGSLSVKSPAPTKATLTRLHAFQEKTSPLLLPDPTLGFYSPTASANASANLAVTDAATNYILGRGKLDDLKSAITSWKSGAGNKIRSEYLTSLKKYT